MRTALQKPSIALVVLAFAICGQNTSGQSVQTQPPPQPTNTSNTSQPSTKPPHQGSASGDAGRGAGDIGKGTAKGAGAAAKGVGKGAGDLVTLHPLDAAGNVGKGGAVAGKDIGVGAAKGTGKIAKGTGRGIGKIFHHHHEAHTAPAPSEPRN